MAKQLNFDLDNRGGSKYPWHEWTNGKAWLLVRGEDFVCPVSTMRSSVYQYARRNDMTVVVNVPSAEEVARLRGKNGLEAKLAGWDSNSVEALIVQFSPAEPDVPVDMNKMRAERPAAKKVVRKLRRKTAK